MGQGQETQEELTGQPILQWAGQAGRRLPSTFRVRRRGRPTDEGGGIHSEPSEQTCAPGWPTAYQKDATLQNKRHNSSRPPNRSTSLSDYGPFSYLSKWRHHDKNTHARRTDHVPHPHDTYENQGGGNRFGQSQNEVQAQVLDSDGTTRDVGTSETREMGQISKHNGDSRFNHWTTGNTTALAARKGPFVDSQRSSHQRRTETGSELTRLREVPGEHTEGESLDSKRSCPCTYGKC